MYLGAHEKNIWVRQYRCDECKIEIETEPESFYNTENDPPLPEGWVHGYAAAIHYCPICRTVRKKRLREERIERHRRDRERWELITDHGCMLCGVEHKGTTNCHLLNCFLPVHESVPEAIDMLAIRSPHRNRFDESYYIRLCPDCAASLQSHLKSWRDECVREPVTIILNGEERQVTAAKLSYENVLFMAYGDRTHRTVTYSYSALTSERGGSLTEGDEVDVQDGMVINAADTSNA